MADGPPFIQELNMAIAFYEWEDANDPYAVGAPDLTRHPWARCLTRAQVRKEWEEYLKEVPDLKHKPKIRVWKISYEKVKVKV
jgi:hypothetical protein